LFEYKPQGYNSRCVVVMIRGRLSRLKPNP
jgi:hypothetical protein